LKREPTYWYDNLVRRRSIEKTNDGLTVPDLANSVTRMPHKDLGDPDIKIIQRLTPPVQWAVRLPTQTRPPPIVVIRNASAGQRRDQCAERILPITPRIAIDTVGQRA
jgi:hypothetical protein